MRKLQLHAIKYFNLVFFDMLLVFKFKYTNDLFSWQSNPIQLAKEVKNAYIKSVFNIIPVMGIFTFLSLNHLTDFMPTFSAKNQFFGFLS